MCGIFGYVGNKTNAAKIVLKGLKSLEYRGYDSWGIAVVTQKKDETKIIVKKQPGKIGTATVDDLPSSTFAFGHTRWATHGGVTQANAHPHLDCNKNIAIIHNGIMENYEEVKRKLKKSGHIFHSDTDSEVIAHLIEEFCKTMSFSKAFQKTFTLLQGLNAVIAMHTKDTVMIAARNGSPLVVGFGDKENLLASDAAALLPYTKQVHYLEENELAIIGPSGIQLFDAKTGENLHPRKQNLDWTVEQAEKGSYPFFMIKEIHEQPGIIADIATNSASHAEDTAKIMRKANDIHLVGCGTAHYACITGDYLFSKISKKHVMECVGSEFIFRSHFITNKSLIMTMSQSGETMDTIEALKYAKAKGANTFALVNARGSSLYRLSDYKSLLSAGPEKGVASTKTFTSKLAHLLLMAHALNGEVKNGQKELVSAAKEAKRILESSTIKLVHQLAQKMKHIDHIYTIGRGLSYPIALEIALKIKEISYIHAEGFAGGELKHGVIALIEKGTPCICIMPDDDTYGNTLSGAMEMKARGGYIIGISSKPHEIYDYFITVKNVGDATVIPNVIVGQLLAYYLAIERGFDPDMPRNLAKSVTVK